MAGETVRLYPATATGSGRLTPAHGGARSVRATGALRGGLACLLLAHLVLAAAPASAAENLTAGIDCDELVQLEPLLARPAPRYSHYRHVEAMFHHLLLDWPDHGGAATAAGLSDLERRLAERLACLGAPSAESWRRRAGGVRVAYRDQLPKPGAARPGALFLADPRAETRTISPFICLAVVEGKTLRPTFTEHPSTLLPLARLYQLKHAHQLAQRRRAYAQRSLVQVETLLAAYREGAGETASGDAAATILALAAVELAATRSIEATREAVAVLHGALELEPTHFLALYLAARYEEKLADYPHALAHLRELEAIDPADGEVGLRLALQLARTGETAAARDRLAGLAGARPDWVAIVAAEEHAALLAAGGRPADAAAVLRTALQRFPGSSQLKLQLAQTRHEEWRLSWPLVDEVLNGWSGDRGEPARVQYERGRPLELARTAAALDRELAPAQELVVEAVAALTERSERQQRADSQRPESLCHGVLPMRRLPGDAGDGPFAPGSPGGAE